MENDPTIRGERRPEPIRSYEPVSYIAVFVVVLAAVIIGNLFSIWVVAKYAQYEAQVAFKEAARIMSDQSQRAKESMEQVRREQHIREQQRQNETREQRAASPTGRKLEQQSSDWTAAYKNFKSEAALQEQTRHCNRYHGYLVTGQ